jgi:hypothetical protein
MCEILERVQESGSGFLASDYYAEGRGWNSGAKNYRPWNEGKTNSNYLIGGKVENDMRGNAVSHPAVAIYGGHRRW